MINPILIVMMYPKYFRIFIKSAIMAFFYQTISFQKFMQTSMFMMDRIRSFNNGFKTFLATIFFPFCFTVKLIPAFLANTFYFFTMICSQTCAFIRTIFFRVSRFSSVSKNIFTNWAFGIYCYFSLVCSCIFRSAGRRTKYSLFYFAGKCIKFFSAELAGFRYSLFHIFILH